MNDEYEESIADYDDAVSVASDSYQDAMSSLYEAHESDYAQYVVDCRDKGTDESDIMPIEEFVGLL